MRKNPGEFFASIVAGPYRGIPAIHLVATDEVEPVENIPRLVADSMSYCSVLQPGKAFVYVCRELPEELILLLKSFGCYLIAEASDDLNPVGYSAYNHVMRSSAKAEMVKAVSNSFVYVPDTDIDFMEPEFSPANIEIPKFLYIRTMNDHVINFMKNAQYPWAIQILQAAIFKIDLQSMYEEDKANEV